MGSFPGAAILRRDGRIAMNLPKIDISALPDLDTPTGVHGSRLEQRTDDPIVVLMVYTYIITHSGGGGG